MTDIIYRHFGVCPICEQDTQFISRQAAYRDDLLCANCDGGSLPRERALAVAVKAYLPGWKSAVMHESSPANRGLSARLRIDCPGYMETQFFPSQPLGQYYNGVRNENLEKQTFQSSVFDLVITLDVMEHVGRPDLVCREIARTLKPGGYYIFTTPTYKNLVLSNRRAIYFSDGVEHLTPAEYHGNPIDENGSLVTFHYGYDLAEMIYVWSGMHVCVQRYHDPEQGIIGEFTEVYICRKSAPDFDKLSQVP